MAGDDLESDAPASRARAGEVMAQAGGDPTPVPQPQPVGQPPPKDGLVANDANTSPGVQNQWCGATGKKDNPLKPWSSEQVSVHLYSRPGAGYEMTILDAASDREICKSRTDDSQTRHRIQENS